MLMRRMLPRRPLSGHSAPSEVSATALCAHGRATARTNGSLRSWIYRIATNEALRALSGRRSERCEISDVFGLFADEYVDYSDLESVKLQQAILSLPHKQQLAFNLRYYDEMDYDEIARITGSTAVNVKVNYHLAKSRIIKYIKTHD